MRSTRRNTWLILAALGMSVLLGGCGLNAGGPNAGRPPSSSRSSAHRSGPSRGKTGAAKRSIRKGTGQARSSKSSGGKAQTGAARTVPWMTYAPAAKTATLKLVAGYNTNLSGFNFDGYGKGRMVVAVPTGWKVTVDFSNQGQMPHSVAIVHTATSTAPAFPGAGLPASQLTSGLPPGHSATFTFTTGAPGKYRIACLVPGHETAGMWDTLTVTASDKTPSVKT